jgi:uncharacterized protein YegL
MAGEPIESVRQGIQDLVTSLRQDPHDLGDAYLSIITFSDYATQVVPLTDLTNFQIPSFSAAGGSKLGEALKFLVRKVEEEFIKTTAEIIGDWEPSVFILSAGDSNDIPEGVKVFNKRKWGIVVACVTGNETKVDKLKLITDYIMNIHSANPSIFKCFFKWPSASISILGISNDTENKTLTDLDQLPPLPPEFSIF